MWVRPSTAFYGGFSLGTGRSPGFGHALPDFAPFRAHALFTLALTAAPPLHGLTLPGSAARRTVLQKVRGRALLALPQFVDTGFQVLFHSPPGVLFTFPSQYSALSVTREYLGLEGGPPGFPRGFTCPAVLWIQSHSFHFRIRGSHPLWPAFPCRSPKLFSHMPVRNPGE